jgi:hypothetical protein
MVRDLYRRQYAAMVREQEIMKDVPGWMPGASVYYGERYGHWGEVDLGMLGQSILLRRLGRGRNLLLSRNLGIGFGRERKRINRNETMYKVINAIASPEPLHSSYLMQHRLQTNPKYKLLARYITPHFPG